MTHVDRGLADVTYRATAAGRKEVAIHLHLTPEAATVADAWARLTAVQQDIDPLSLEIEIREGAGT